MCSEISLGPLSWSPYLVMALLGAFAAFLFYNSIFDQFRMSFKRFLVMMTVILTGMICGSKILFVITELPVWLKNPSLWSLLEEIWMAGFVFYGGLFGALIALKIWCKLTGLEFSEYSNKLVVGFPIFHAFGRIGCLLSGCCYGFRWKYGILMEDGVRRFPIQLVEAGCEIGIAVVLVKLFRNGNKNLTQIYLGLYAVVRFVIEFFRADTVRGIWFGLSTSQWLSLFILVYLIFYLRKDLKNE